MKTARLTPQDILDEMQANFDTGARRKFLPGLLIAFIDFLRELNATGGRFKSLEDFYAAYPRQLTTAAGNKANTLIVKNGDRTLSIRRFYDSIQNWFRSDQKRFDYPSAAPHATQAWEGYSHWLNALLAFSNDELDELIAKAKKFVLDKLPSQDVDPNSIVREPARFLLFLEKFDMTARRGENTGAAYQGTVFGYIRADAPHLQVEVGKVRTGSKREKRVGDIDARDGDALVLSAEVKQFVFRSDGLPDVAEFANLISRHKALGMIVALDFDEGVREKILDLGLQPVSREDLRDRVKLWDPLKQKIAVNALLYYIGFREQSSALYARVKKFLEDIESTEPGSE
jgi:hypothetical protein